MIPCQNPSRQLVKGINSKLEEDIVARKIANKRDILNVFVNVTI